MNRSTIFASGFLVFSIAVIGAGYLYQNRAISLETANAAATTSPLFAADVGPTGDIKVLSNTVSTLKAPDFTRALVIKTKLSAQEKAAIQAKYEAIQAVLKKDPNSFNEWVFMGNTNLFVGNYDLAKEYWEYASAKWPTNVASFNNLGDLYMNYLKDYPKAEKNFLQAIANKPDDTNPYRSLFTLYTETSYKPSNTAAEDILKKGIAANPKAVELQVMLARWYQKTARPQEAKTAFQAALNAATAQGLTQLAAQIRTEAGIK